MASINRFEQSEAWKASRILANKIYKMTRQAPFWKDYALRDQIRRSVISVPTNIAEGFERTSPNEFAYFLSIAKGSAGEVRSLLYLAFDNGYIDAISFNKALEQAETTSRLIAGLIRYLKSLPKKRP